MNEDSKNLRIYGGVYLTLLMWFLITKFYLHWSPFGEVGSIGISVAAAAIGYVLTRSIGKALARQVPTILYLLGIAGTSGATLLTTAYYTAGQVDITVDCKGHTISNTELNRFEKASVVFTNIIGPVESKFEFVGVSPLWESKKKRKKRITVLAPGASPYYRVNEKDAHYHFTYTCGSDAPSNGMIQIPRQM